MNQPKDEGELAMQEVETCEAMRKVLFIDIPGVLNTSKSPYNFVSFDKDKMALLREIVRRTQCEIVLAPSLPWHLTLKGDMRRCLGGISNLLNALYPEWNVGCIDDVGIAVAMFANKENPITSFAVVRCQDTPELEWQLTFPTRCVKVASDAGLSEATENAIVHLLHTRIKEDEIPMKVVTKGEIESAVRKRFRTVPAPEEIHMVCDDEATRFMEKVDEKVRAQQAEAASEAHQDGRSGLGGR